MRKCKIFGESTQYARLYDGTVAEGLSAEQAEIVGVVRERVLGMVK